MGGERDAERLGGRVVRLGSVVEDSACERAGVVVIELLDRSHVAELSRQPLFGAFAGWMTKQEREARALFVERRHEGRRVADARELVPAAAKEQRPLVVFEREALAVEPAAPVRELGEIPAELVELAVFATGVLPSVRRADEQLRLRGT